MGKLVLSLFVFVAFVAIVSKCAAAEDGELYRWTVMEYLKAPRAPTYKIRDRDYYIPENNIPTGITPTLTRVFVTIPRRDYGIPSTLNYIDLRAARDQKSPPLQAYPSYEMNELHTDLKPDITRIVSVYRSRADECNRLWFVDTGTLDTKDHATFIQDPSIWVIDLRTDKMLRRFEIPNSLEDMPSGLQSITVDSDRTRCDEAFAYIPNTKNNKILVYSFKDDDAWVFTDDTFKLNEQLTEMTINQEDYVINEGLYSIALGPRSLSLRNRTRPVYYHPLASFYEFQVSNAVLKSKEFSKRTDHLLDFTYLGTRGDNTQSGIHDFDIRNRVLFTTQIQKSSISCWNIDKHLTPHNVATVAQNNDTLIYPVDLKVERLNIWYLSNQWPVLEKSGMDVKKFHFYVFRRPARAMIDGTVCAARVNAVEPTIETETGPMTSTAMPVLASTEDPELNKENGIEVIELRSTEAKIEAMHSEEPSSIETKPTESSQATLKDAIETVEVTVDKILKQIAPEIIKATSAKIELAKEPVQATVSEKAISETPLKVEEPAVVTETATPSSMVKSILVPKVDPIKTIKTETIPDKKI